MIVKALRVYFISRSKNANNLKTFVKLHSNFLLVSILGKEIYFEKSLSRKLRYIGETARTFSVRKQEHKDKIIVTKEPVRHQ